MNSLNEIILALKSSSTWIILAHERPDGDTLGCGSALLQRGVSLNKRCMWGGPDPLPQVYSFLPFGGSYSCWESLPLKDNVLPEETLIIVLDTSNLERSVNGLASAARFFPVINIDHHGDNSRFGKINWIDESSSSAGEMIFDLFSAAGWRPTQGEAEALFVAISTDTGFFRFPCTTAKALDAASVLVSCGASPADLHRKIFENRTLGGLHLWGYGFSRARLYSNGEICMTFLAEDDFSASMARKEEAQNLVNALLSVSGVLVAVLMQEDKGFCRVSIRTRDPINARSIAAIWGGGGHALAAGCKIQGNLSEARDDFILRAGDISEAGIPGN